MVTPCACANKFTNKFTSSVDCDVSDSVLMVNGLYIIIIGMAVAHRIENSGSIF